MTFIMALAPYPARASNYIVTHAQNSFQLKLCSRETSFAVRFSFRFVEVFLSDLLTFCLNFGHLLLYIFLTIHVI